MKCLLLLLVSIPMISFGQINEIHCGAFNYLAFSTPANDSTYLVMNDGSTRQGQKIKWASGVLSANKIHIDDEKFGIKEVKGYFEKGKYYARIDKEFIPRLVTGKLSLYVSTYSFQSTSAGGYRSTDKSCYHYLQKKNGEIQPLASLEDFQAMVSDCPIALNLVSLTNKELRKAVKANSKYLNEVLEIYNSGACKKVKQVPTVKPTI